MKMKALLPLKIAQIVAAFSLAIGCFLGFPHDALLGGLFWAVTAAILIVEVMEHVQNGRSNR